MTQPIVKNESVGFRRTRGPIPVYDADGQLINTNPTFDHTVAVAGVTGVVKQVEVWNGTDWVEASANPTEIKGATGTASGLFQYTFSQAETNHDTFIGVRICQTGFLRPLYLMVDITATDIDTVASDAALGLAAVEASLATIETKVDTVQTAVTSIQNNTRCVRVVPDKIIIPSASTRTYRIELLLYDEAGSMETPDAPPTIALVNQSGTDRSSRLDSTTMAFVSTGRYRAIYTSTAGDAQEQLVWAFTVTEGAVARVYGNNSSVEPLGASIVDANVVSFTAGAITNTAFSAGALSAITNSILDSLVQDHAVVGSVGDSIAIAAGLLQGNFFIDNTDNTDPNGQTFARARVFRSGAVAAIATPGGSGQGEFATFNVTTTYVGVNKIATHRSVRV